MSDYSWVEDKKKEALMKKLARRGMPSYRQLPISDRYGTSYTGTGLNGRVDPGAIAGTDMAGRPYHEGETKIDMPEGSTYINARMTDMMMGNRGSAPMMGFQAGGFSPADFAGGVGPNQSAIDAAKQNQIENPAGTGVMNSTPGVSATDFAGGTGPSQGVIKNLNTAVAGRNINAPAPEAFKLPELPTMKIEKSVTADQFAPPAGVQPMQIQPGAAVQKEASVPSLSTEPAGVQPMQIPPEQGFNGLAGRQGVGYAPPPAPAAPTQDDLARKQGMDYLLGMLAKENPAALLEGRRAMSELGLRQQQEQSMKEQQLVQQGVSPDVARVEMQMLRNKQESELNALAADFGIAGMKSREAAAGTLASQGLAGQQFALEQKKFDAAAAENKGTEEWKKLEVLMKSSTYEEAAAKYREITGGTLDKTVFDNARKEAKPAATEVSGRMNLFLGAGEGIEVAIGDQTTRDMVALTMPSGATKEAIDAEITRLYKAAVDTNKNGFGANVDSLVDSIIRNQGTLAEAIGRDDIRQNAAGVLGVSKNDPRVDKYIEDTWKDMTLPAAERIFNNLVGYKNADGTYTGGTGIITPEIMSVDGWERDLRNVISDSMTADGKLDVQEKGWPWENPETYFKYHDWNGNQAVGAYDQNAAITITDSRGRPFVTTAGPVAMKDANAAWDNLGPMDRSNYVDAATGEIDTKKFLSKAFPVVTTADGSGSAVVSLDSYDEKMSKDQDFRTYVDSILGGWSSVRGAVTYKDENGNVQEVGDGSYLYYDKDGKPQTSEVGDGNFGYILQQMSNKYPELIKTGEDLLDATTFASVWKNGKDWVVGAGGKILNLNGMHDYAQNAIYDFKPGVTTYTKNVLTDLSKTWDSDVSDNFKTSGPSGFLENTPTTIYTETIPKMWTVAPAVRDWVKNNTGKLYKASNGKIYEIVGINENKGYNETGGVKLRDIETGKDVEYTVSGGGSQARNSPLPKGGY